MSTNAWCIVNHSFKQPAEVLWTEILKAVDGVARSNGSDVRVLHGDYWRLTMELLSLMVVMLEGLGFNLCVAPFLNICVLNLFQRGRKMSEVVRVGSEVSC